MGGTTSGRTTSGGNLGGERPPGGGTPGQSDHRGGGHATEFALIDDGLLVLGEDDPVPNQGVAPHLDPVLVEGPLAGESRRFSGDL